MKQILLVLFLTLTFGAFGQSEKYEFIGTIQLIDKSLISYKIVFEEGENGVINGKSISDFAGSHRTESAIRGRLDRKRNIISFQEEENISTKSNYPDSTFCYVHLYNAKLTLKKNKRIIQGHFYSRYKDGSLCIEGDIYLIGEEEMMKKFDKVTKRAKIFVKDEKFEKAEKSMASTKENLKNVLLADNDQMVFDTKSEKFQLKIWDAEHVDGDRISVYKNDQLILDNFSVVKEPKFLTIEMENASEEIKVIANNEGRIPPNSANIEIVDKDNLTPLKVRLNKGKEVKLVFRKQ